VSFLREYRARVIGIAALAVAEIGLAALAPWPLKAVVDNVLGRTPFPPTLDALLHAVAGRNLFVLLVVIVLAGLVLQLGHEVVRMVQTQLEVDTGQRVVYKLRERLLQHLQALPLRHHVLTRTADSVYRLDADAYCINDLIIGGVFPLAIAITNLVVMFGILVYVDWTLGLLSLAVVPFLYVSLRYYAREMNERAERVKVLESSLVERAYEILSSIGAVKSFARERYEQDRFSSTGTHTMDARLRLTWQESLFSVCVTTITLAGTALVLTVGGLHVLAGRLTIGSLLVVIAYLAAVYNPLSSIAHTTGSLQQALVSARRVKEVFALAQEPFDAPTSADASLITGHIQFEEVSFAYDTDRVILRDVTFEAQQGDMIALVGLTGAGKTTLVNLIPRFYEPTVGRVLIDGLDASCYSLHSLRERIALVPQEPVLFSGTIRDNIRYGRLDASDWEVEEAARAALVHDFVTRLPRGYETPVAEAGGTLSGGERQRLGIARAILKDAPILILDEPTSALDALSEEAVFAALRRLRHGRTTLVIAHRLSTIRDADCILVLNDGRVVARGSHEALIETNELYRRMCARLSVGRPLEEPESIDALIQAIS
jgi:ABC-type multidrug transport system fused ATPase/permease subunit